MVELTVVMTIMAVMFLYAIPQYRVAMEQAKVDFADPRNLMVAAIPLVLGTGDFTLRIGSFALGGIGTATFGAILLWALLRPRKDA